MYIIGDIGNTEVKICLFSSNKKLIKKIYLKTNLINLSYLKKKLSKLIKKNVSINRILFSSVVPNIYKLISSYFFKNFKIRCIEIKKLNLSKLIKIHVNKKQIGSDSSLFPTGPISEFESLLKK